MRSRWRRVVLRLRISVVIQGVGEVRKVLLILVEGRNEQVVSEGLKNMCRAGRASCWDG